MVKKKKGKQPKGGEGSGQQAQQSQPQQGTEQPQSSLQEQQSQSQQRQEYQQGSHRQQQQQQQQQQDRKPYEGQRRQQPSEQERWPRQEERQQSYEGSQHFQQSQPQRQYQSRQLSQQPQYESPKHIPQQQPVSPPSQQISQGRSQQWGPATGVGRARGRGSSQQQVQPPGLQQGSPSAGRGLSTAPGSELLSPQYPQPSGLQPRGPSAGRGSSTAPGSELSSPQYPQPSGAQPWGSPARMVSSTAPQNPQPSDSPQRQTSKGKGRSKPTQPTSVERDSSILARGDTVSTPSGTSDRPVREITSAMEKVSIATGPPRPSTGGGDAPSPILPHTSTSKRRGGTEGRKIKVQTNFFPLNIGKLETAIHYDVAITPDKPKKFLRPAMEEFRRKQFNNRWPAYDGNKNLYSSSPLFESNEISDTVKIMEDGSAKEFQVTVKFATYVDLTCLQNYIENVRGKSLIEMDKPMQALQCVDIVLRSAPAFSCIPVGRSYFTRPYSPYTLGDGAVLYTGFFQAAILGWKPFVNIDVAHKAFPAAVNVVEMLSEFGVDSLNSEIKDGRDRINKHIKQLKIQYEIPGKQASRKIYRVNELGPSPNNATFKDDKGKTATVTEYFKTKKDVSLRYPNLSTLWVGSRNRDNKILLPMEFCTILPDQVVNKKMTDIQTRNMIRQAATNTETRMKNILNSVSKANYNQSPAMREFGITVDSTPQQVDARILSPPILKYENNKTVTVSKGIWSAKEFLNGAKLDSWTVLSLDRSIRPNDIAYLEGEIIKYAKELGMQISEPAKFTALHEYNLRNVLQKYFTAKKDCQIIVVILDNRKESYNIVKQTSEIAVGCLTQCLKSMTVKKRLSASTVNNILLKINAKLNGVNHSLHDLPSCLGKPTIIMGADVTHPGPDSQDFFPSVAAVTASMDARFFRYKFEWSLQSARQEMIQELQQFTKNHLMNFYKRNNKVKPEKIIYVRDGVSDGQFMQVLNVELTAIRRACTSLQPDYKPAVVFIVVQKRHHTRFFPIDKRIAYDKNCNVPAGTCVDTEITHPSISDFYLVSHASIQGVARPTKYVKLWDDCDLSEDEVEKLMYYLCHMFARCNRSVSYPAPTYYAHLAAARARVYCENNHVDMSNLPETQRRLQVQEYIIEGMPMFFV